MENRDIQLFTKMALTFFILIIAMTLLETILSNSRFYFIFGIICGFYFSWFMRNKPERITKYFVTVCACVILAWIPYSILNSSFFYEDVVAICIKGVLFLEIALAFGAHFSKNLSYMQTLSIPLFMCFPLFVKGTNEILILPVLLYLVGWLVILRMQFYEIVNIPIRQINLKRKYSIILTIIIFCISLCFAVIFFSNFRFARITKGGLFLAEGIGAEGIGENIEKDYLGLQDELLKKIIDIISKIGTTEDKYSMLQSLDYLVKDASTIEQVEHAEEGLISYLKNPGLGLEKNDAEEAILLLKGYINKKIQYNLKKIEESITADLKKNPLDLKGMLAASNLVHKMLNSDSPGKVLDYEKKLQEVTNNSSLSSYAKKGRFDLIGKFKDWKSYELSLRQQGLSVSAIKETTKAESISPEEVTVLPQQAQKKLSGLEKPQEAPEQLIGNLKAVNAWQVLIWVMLSMLCLIILGTIILFIILYFLTLRQKNRLISLYKNPQQFILDLYENVKTVITIFGIRYKEALAPLSYAALIEKRLLIQDNLFSGFTVKFEEAKYSRHILKSEDANLALDDYNNFLKVLFNSHNKFTRISKFFLSIVYRRPLSIYKGEFFLNPQANENNQINNKL